ncbi:MAG: DinB family protein [Pyrinomonadaceae bacterium]
MEYKTVDDVYAANAAIREKFKSAFASLSDEQLNAKPEGEGWSIAQIVEHVAVVNGGALRICSKLLGKGETAGKSNDGSVFISPEFIEAGSSAVGQKLEAPEMVRPINNIPLVDSIAKLDELQGQYAELKEKFATVDGVDAKFPHPYFGDLSAQEWLVLSGAHEIRHLKQIRRVLEALH